MLKPTGKFRISKQIREVWARANHYLTSKSESGVLYVAFIEVTGKGGNEWVFLPKTEQDTVEKCREKYEEYVEFYSNNTIEQGEDPRLLNITAQGL